MRIGLIADEDRMLHEHATINRVAIGLLSEGLKVTRITPESGDDLTLEESESRLALVTRLTAPMRVLPWMRGERAARMIEAFEKQTPDVLLAMGDAAWSLGLDLAERLEIPVALNVWSQHQLRQLPTGHRASLVAAYFAPTAMLARSLREMVDNELVCHIPTSVVVPAQCREVLSDPEGPISIAIVGGVRDVASYRAMLAGLSRVAAEFRQIQVFLELRGPYEQEIWKLCRKLDLLEHVSTVSYAAHQRRLLTQCDIMILPERYGELRSVMLEAMAAGIPVIASADPFLDILDDGVTASIVTEPETDASARALRRLLTDRDAARELGAGGRARIIVDHRSTDVIGRLVTTFRQITHGGAVQFDA